MTEAVLRDIEDGAVFGTSVDDPDATHTLHLIFAAADGTEYFVEIPRPNFASVESLRTILPVGSKSVVYLQPNNDPRDANYFQLHDGPAWFFTTPQGWIQQDPERGVTTPLEQADLGIPVPAGGTEDLSAWLPEG